MPYDFSSIQINVTSSWFLIVGLILGISIGAALPSVGLVGFRSVAPQLSETISSYLGGVGISFLIGGSGLLIGTSLRALLTMTKSSAKNPVGSESNQAAWFTSLLCCVLGAGMTGWYLWSYLHIA